jgi:hypothetical protein
MLAFTKSLATLVEWEANKIMPLLQEAHTSMPLLRMALTGRIAGPDLMGIIRNFLQGAVFSKFSAWLCPLYTSYAI